MANPYSEDLRIKALNIVEAGKPVRETGKLLGIGRSSIFRWIKLNKEKGTIKPRENWRKGHSHKVQDLEEFKKFALENQGLTATQMAHKRGGMSPKTMRMWLHKAGFTRKKDLWL